MAIHGPRNNGKKEKKETFYDTLTPQQINSWKKLLVISGFSILTTSEYALREAINAYKVAIDKGIERME